MFHAMASIGSKLCEDTPAMGELTTVHTRIIINIVLRE
jgi:hypothetical protein